MKASLEPVRRRFLLRSFAVIVGAAAGCFAVAWIARLGQHGVLLGSFLAAFLLVICVRVLSELWSATGLEVLEGLRSPLNFPGHKMDYSRDVETNFEELRDHFAATSQRTRRLTEQRRQLMSEVFHALSQPLTTLRCSLELGLRTRHSTEEYRTRLAQALEQAERTVRMTAQLRRLAEAIDCDDRGQTCRFDEALKLAAEEITALGEVRKVGVQIGVGPPVVVACDEQRLAQALFHLLEFVLDSASQEGEVVGQSKLHSEGLVFAVGSKMASTLEPEPTGGTVDLDDEGSRATLGLRIADYILQTVGGKLERQLVDDRQVLRATLPVMGVAPSRKNVEPVVAEVSSSDSGVIS